MEGRLQAFASRRHQRRVKRRRHRQRQDPSRTEFFAALAGAANSGRTAGDHYLARRVEVDGGHGSSAGRLFRPAGRFHLIVPESDDRGHRAFANRNRCLHQPAATPDRAGCIVDAETTGGNYRRILAKAVTGHSTDFQTGAGEYRPRGNRMSEQRRLGVLRQSEVFFRSIPTEFGERAFKPAIHGLEDGGSRSPPLGEIAAHTNGLAPLTREQRGNGLHLIPCLRARSPGHRRSCCRWSR